MMSSTKRFSLFSRKQSAPDSATATPTAATVAPAIAASGAPTPTAEPPAPTAAPTVVPGVGGKIALTQSLKRAMRLSGNDAATVYKNRRHTWNEFGDRVARLAGAFRALGVQDGDRIAILALNSDRYLETYFAAAWSGAVIVPMNIRWAIPENVYSLNDSGAIILIVDDAFHGQIPAIRADVPGLKAVLFAGDGELPEGLVSYEAALAEAEPLPDRFRGGADLAGIFYTGGTTGFPKGVMLSHQALWTNAISTMHECYLTNDNIYLHAAPMFHLADVAGSNGAAIAGATHTFIPMFNPEHVLTTIGRERVTHTVLVPTMIGAMVHHPAVDQADLSSMQYMLYGGSPIPEATLRLAIEKLPNCKFVQAYGQTELAPVATALPPNYHALAGPKANKLRSAGRPTYCMEVKIVNPDGQEEPRGGVGEIVARGPNTMLGYWNKPEETARTLVDGWVHTGDGGYMDDDGFVFVVDRLKDMIVTGGENVYSVEVENAVVSHPAVQACAVIGIPSDEWGEAVHAVVVLKPGAQATPEEIMTHCRALIANYKCPRSVSYVESLPLSGAGKVLKRDLREPYWNDYQRRVN